MPALIIDLPSTTSSTINKKMIEMREKGGANAQGRVLTLVIVTDEDSSEDPIAAANGASFEHPCRVIVIAKGSKRGTARLDAQIRVGGDAGASEVIVLRLYGPLADHGAAVVIPLLLADAPVVVWWPGESPDSPADDPIGALAQRRITDSAASRRPIAALTTRRANYRPGDTDLAWTRLTNWRGLLAAALDQPPHERITEATVAGASDSASADLLAGWLALQLRCPVRRIKVDRSGSGLRAVTLLRRSGEISLVRPEGVTATLSVSHQAPRELTLPRRILRDCIAEELRRLDADDVYSDVLSKGLDLVAKAAATEAGTALPTSTANRTRARLAGHKDPTAKSTVLKTVASAVATEKPAPSGSARVASSSAAATPAGSDAAAKPAEARSAAKTAGSKTRSQPVASRTRTRLSAPDSANKTGSATKTGSVTKTSGAVKTSGATKTSRATKTSSVTKTKGAVDGAGPSEEVGPAGDGMAGDAVPVKRRGRPRKVAP